MSARTGGAVDTRLRLGHSGLRMAESVTTSVRLEQSVVVRIDGLVEHVRRQGGYIATRSDALRDVLAKGVIALERAVRSSERVRFDAPLLAGGGVQLMCRLDPLLVERADAIAATLTKQVGIPVQRALVLREAVELGIARLEAERDAD